MPLFKILNINRIHYIYKTFKYIDILNNKFYKHINQLKKYIYNNGKYKLLQIK